MAITRLSQSSIKEGLEKFPSFYGGASFIFGDLDAITTVTVGSGGSSSIDLTDIPATYKHLQIHVVGQSNRSAEAVDDLAIRINNDSSNSYARHLLVGLGTTVFVSASVNQTSLVIPGAIGTVAQTSNFGSSIIDILDYTNTTKTKTISVFAGKDNNGTYAGTGGYINISSGLYFANTSAVNRVTLTATNGNWQQYSTATVYGVKAP